MPRGKSAREFGIDLRRFGRVTRDQYNLIFRKIALDLDQRIVLSTPVDTGRARGNWIPSLTFPSTDVTDELDPQGTKAIAAASRLVNGASMGDMIWFTNNLPYILPLENGHSTQAPQGMVDLNVLAVVEAYGGEVIR